MIDTVKNGIHLRIQTLDEKDGGRLALSAFAARSPAALVNPLGKPELQGFCQVHLTGENQAAHHGGQHQGSNAGGVLRYQSHEWGANASGETLTVVEVSNFYPASHPVPFTWDGRKKVLSVAMTEKNSARIFRFNSCSVITHPA